MRKADLSEEEVIEPEPIHMTPESNLDASKVNRLAASTAAMLVGAGAVAVIVPVAILSLMLFLMGAS